MAAFTITPLIPPKPLDPRYLECRSVEGPALAFKALLGPTAPNVTGGHGGWEEVARPKRTGFTNYKGTPLYTVKIEVVFDGFLESPVRSVEPELFQVSAMGGKVEELGRPPVVTYYGGVPGSGRTWVVNDIERGDTIRRETDGRIVRQFLTITFLEYRAPIVQLWESTGPANDALARHNAEEAAAAAAASKQAASDGANLDPAANPAVEAGAAAGASGGNAGGGGGGGGGGPFGILNIIGLIPGSVGVLAGGAVGAGGPPAQGGAGYLVKSGDTLTSIAARVLGSVSRWQEIAGLNGIDDPLSLRVGQHLKMPSGNFSGGGGGGAGGGGGGW